MKHDQAPSNHASGSATTASVGTALLFFGRDGARVSADAVEFVARWRASGTEDVVRLSQAPSQPVVGVASGDDADAAARAATLAEFFGSIRLDLDGCELTFRSMAVRRQLLEVTLDVCVRRFPNPMTINF